MREPSSDGGSLGRGARLRILAAAHTLFGRQGMGATSINDLRAQARVSKRTLYEHFASKDELLLEYVRQSGLTAAARVLDREALTPRARLLELFTALADGPPPVLNQAAILAEHQGPDLTRAAIHYPFPDPVLAAAVEFPDAGHPVHQAAGEQSKRFLERLGELASAAGADNPERVARRLALVYAGATARLLLDDPAAVAADAHALAALILRDAID
ncbi:MAG: helix-turn-helix domain-containing protein [Solirubrobacteraceae bacterium]